MPDLIRNKATESDIRDWLDENGFYGRRAEFESVELFAIGRPGWKQLFRFEVRAAVRSDEQLPDAFDEKWGPGCSEKKTIWGAILDDERLAKSKQKQVEIFDEETALEVCLDDWSTGMISASSSRADRPDFKTTAMLLAFVVAALAMIAVLRNL